MKILMMTLATLAVLPTSAQAQFELDTLLTPRAGARLELDNHDGDVLIEAWDRSQVRIRASRRRGVEIDVDESGLTIEGGWEGHRGGSNATTFDLRVPAGMDLEVETLNGDIVIRGSQGRIEVESVNGNVDVTGGRTLISLGSVKGSVRSTGARGSLQAESINAGVSIRDAVGDIAAETVNGPIELVGIDAGQVDASSVNGRIDFAGRVKADGWYQMETHNGAVTVRLPRGSGATVTAHTFNGEIEAGVPINVREMEPGKEVTFTVGAGGARMELSTFNGAIRIETDAR